MSNSKFLDDSNLKINFTNSDFSLPFLLDKVGINGRLVALSESVTEIINKHNYPDQISYLLAELLVFTTLLGSNLKSDGIVTVEIKANQGIAKLFLADYVFGGNIRGYASFNETSALTDKTTFRDLIKEGYLVITVDLGEDFQRYQGIVEIKGESLITSIMEYMESSQQINAVIKTVVAKTKTSQEVKWLANGLMLQTLPANNENKNIIDWPKFKFFVETISDDEMTLLKVTPTELLQRLFHEEGVWLFESNNVKHECRCSREKMAKIVNTLSNEERDSIISENGKIEISCQFCNQKEYFK